MSSDIPFAFSPAEKRALEALAELDRRNRRAGADVRIEAYRITEGLPRLRDWLAESDRLSRELSGSARLRLRRRLGILRWTEGPLRGLPFFEPLMYPTSFGPEPWAKPLLDELEYIVISGRSEQRRWRPTKNELTFDEARGLAQMRAGTLYRLTSKDLVPGLVRRRLGSDERSHTAELRFDTVEFMGWVFVMRTSFGKK